MSQIWLPADFVLPFIKKSSFSPDPFIYNATSLVPAPNLQIRLLHNAATSEFSNKKAELLFKKSAHTLIVFV